MSKVFIAAFVLVVAGLANASPAVMAPIAVGDDVECVICDFLVKEIEAQVAQNKTQSEILADLEKVCKAFGHFEAKCKEEVATYGPALINLLVNKEPPATVCKKVDMCKNSTFASGSDAKCAICELVVGEVDKALMENKTDSEIIARLEDICKVTKHFRTECDSVVAEYVPEIIQRLVNKEDPQMVCDHLRLCANGTEVAVPVAPLRASNETCKVCDVAVTYAEGYLSKHPNVNASDLIVELEKLCKLLPTNDSSKCDSILSLFGPIIFNELKKGVTPEKICHDLHLCDDSVPAPVPAVVLRASNETCKICEDVATYAESWISKRPGANETEFIDQLEKVCKFLPKGDDSKCDAMVSLFGTLIYNELKKGSSPEAICQLVKLCDASSAASSGATFPHGRPGRHGGRRGRRV